MYIMSIRTQELANVQSVDKLPADANFIIESGAKIRKLTAADITKTVAKSILGDNQNLQTMSGIISQIEKNTKNDEIHRLTIPLSGWRDKNGGPINSALAKLPFVQTVNADWITEQSYPELYSDMDEDVRYEQYKQYSKTFSILTTGIAVTNNGSITFKVFKTPVSDINIVLKGG